eukprot:7979052-Lingulodinium_polyedra.AAC.1
MRARAICEPLKRQTVDSTASLRADAKTVHNDAVRIDCPPPRRPANRTLRTHHANAKHWRSHGARDACDARFVAVADDRFVRIIMH